MPTLSYRVTQLERARAHVREISRQIAADLGIIPAFSTPAAVLYPVLTDSAKKRRKPRRWLRVPEDVRHDVILATRLGNTRAEIAKAENISISAIQTILREDRLAHLGRQISKARTTPPRKGQHVLRRQVQQQNGHHNGRNGHGHGRYGSASLVAATAHAA